MATSSFPSGAESSWISKWNTSQATVNPTSITTQLCEECMTTLKLVHKHLLSRVDFSKSAIRCYDRALVSFILWTDGYEVLKGGLDQVVADSWALRRLILRFLSDISRSLAEGFMPTLGLSDEYSAQVSSLRTAFYEAESLLKEGHKLSPNVETGADPDSTSDAESVTSDDSSQGSTISDSRDFDELLADLKTDIQCLRDLGPLIESPYVERPRQPEDTAPVSVQITWQAYQPYGDRILQRFPQAQADLVERLAKANLDRFQKIQEEKRDNLIKQQPHEEAASRISGSVKYRDSALGTSLATESIYAETLMAYGQSEDPTVRVPPLPEGAKSGVPFECLACGRSVSIKNNYAWKKHLWRDLRPWICHDSACDFGNEPFATRGDWIQHLEFDHDFQPSWSSFKCPLCHEETGEGKTAIVHHLARHMEEISLAALPSGYDSDNDLEESGDENEDEDKDEDEGGDVDEDDNGESLGGPFGPMGGMTDFNANPMMNPPGYDGNVWLETPADASSMRFYATSSESMISTEEAKVINTVREYQYYPGPMYEAQGDRVDLFNPRTERDGVVPHMATRLDVQREGSDGSEIPDNLLADASSTHDPTDERPVTSKDHGLPASTISHSARDHDLYTKAAPYADGLYHCPWEGQPSCNHQPQKLKANYDKYVDSHLKPYRCKVGSCEGLRFASYACVLRHEREAHGMHKGTGDFLCVYEGCERAVPGKGFPRRWYLKDHMKRTHNDEMN